MPDIELAKPFDRTLGTLTDLEMQSELLEGVSRTFALTIPRLPEELYPVIANAYLLCRIIDTVEDEVSLSPQLKRDFCGRFIGVVKKTCDAESFTSELLPLLSEQTIPAEHELIRVVPRVIRITHGFTEAQQSALATCVETMAGGMPQFQSQGLKNGLKSLTELDRYCYFVAGCVGEMLTRLFCDYSAGIAPNEQRMLELSVSFGQGLQMTNIIKDVWDDHRRSVCWLPQDLFNEAGFDLAQLSPNHHNPAFCKGLESLIRIAYSHLKNALRYTLLIPKSEIGIRYFCLWALGMAVLTLKKIKANLDFSTSQQVKISRKAVKYTILATRITGRSDLALKALFMAVSYGLGETGQPEHLNNKHLNST
ncbi:MAG: phytoene/squalene synthase family protein [Methylococcaceae bacterium]|nr:phytoene/squalene synthase family protein [Methylococcaceae bacterium]